MGAHKTEILPLIGEEECQELDIAGTLEKLGLTLKTGVHEEMMKTVFSTTDLPRRPYRVH